MEKKKTNFQPKDNLLDKDQKQTVKDFRDYLERKSLKPETVKTYLINLRQLILDVLHKNPTTLTRNDVIEYERYCKKYKKESLSNKYGMINRYLEYLCEKEVITYENLKRWRLKTPRNLKSKKSKREALTEKEVEGILKLAQKHSKRDYALFLTLYSGMLRRNELRALNLEDVDLNNRTLKLYDTKNGEDYTINISKRCANALRDYIENNREEPLEGHEQAVFLNYGWRISKNTLYQIHKEYAYRMNFPETKDFFPHIWRHTGITHYACKLSKSEGNEAIALKKLQAQTRHKSIDVLLDYLHLNTKDIADTYDRAFNNETVEPEVKPPQQITHTQTIDNKEQLRQQLLQRLAKGEISQEVYLLAIRDLDRKQSDNSTFYG